MQRYTRVKKGEKKWPLATTMNDMMEAAEIVLQKSAIPSEAHGTGIAPRQTVKVKNDQPETVPAFGVLAVTGPVHINESLYAQLAQAADRWIEIKGGPPAGEADELLCIVQNSALSTWFAPCVVMGPTPAWVYVNDETHRYAQAIPDNVQMLESAESGPVRLLYAPLAAGLQLLPVLLGIPITAEPPVHAKELFPAVVYRRYREETIDDGSVIQVPETFVICPGGRGTNRSINTVHVLHVEERKVSTATFGSMPIAMSNFGAAIAENGYGDAVLVCAPGTVDDSARYHVQRYDFFQEEWVKSDADNSLAGCPAYTVGDQVVVAGGQSAYSVQATQTSAGGINGSLPMYGHIVTPFWAIDPVTGAMQTRIPRRTIVSGTTPNPESNFVNQQKRFLKQNFSGIPFARSESGRSVEFLGVGGTEMMGYQSRAVVSYAMDGTGPLVDCENADVRLNDHAELFPDTPLPLGECSAVRIRRRRSGEMMVDCDLLVCFGGRYRDAEGTFQTHERPWSLDLANKSEGWRDDLFPPVPTARWNAAAAIAATDEPVIDEETGEPTGDTTTIDRVFLVGGRTADGLTPSIEALNLTTGEWETEWPGLDGRLPKKDEVHGE